MAFVLVRNATDEDHERLLATAVSFVQKYGAEYDKRELKLALAADPCTARDVQLVADGLCQRVRDERYDNSLAHIWTKRARRALRGDGDEIAWNAVGYTAKE